jgi:hypothetical protein
MQQLRFELIISFIYFKDKIISQKATWQKKLTEIETSLIYLKN